MCCAAVQGRFFFNQTTCTRCCRDLENAPFLPRPTVVYPRVSAVPYAAPYPSVHVMAVSWFTVVQAVEEVKTQTIKTSIYL